MRSLVSTFAFLASCRDGGQNSQALNHEMRAAKAIANIHTAETQLQSRTGRYGSLKELRVELPDEWSFALSLTPGSDYTIAVRSHGTPATSSTQRSDYRDPTMPAGISGTCLPYNWRVSSPAIARQNLLLV